MGLIDSRIFAGYVIINVCEGIKDLLNFVAVEISHCTVPCIQQYLPKKDGKSEIVD